jgi:hypothetical protein
MICLDEQRGFGETLSRSGDEEEGLAPTGAEARKANLPSADQEEAPRRIPARE